MVYLYNPAMKPGRSRKFYRPWAGPFKVTKRISELNYEIIDQKGKKQVVHINRLKIAENPELWKPITKQKSENLELKRKLQVRQRLVYGNLGLSR